jgi:hypothetical protein
MTASIEACCVGHFGDMQTERATMADAHWQLDGSAPELYQRYLVPAITVKWAEDLVGRARPQA